MHRRGAAAVALLLTGALLSGCSALHDLAAGSTTGDATPSPRTCLPPGADPDPSPAPAPTLDPNVATQIRKALAAVRALPAVDTVGESRSNAQSTYPDPERSYCQLVENHFSTDVTVTVSPEATPQQAGAVPSTMAKHLAWTGVSLSMTVPAGPGHVASVVHYNRTFDQSIPLETSTGVADGLQRIASTSGVTSVEASIPYTMRVEYGSLTVTVDPADETTLAAVRSVIDGTAFADTTLHGSFHNGAKP
ncbi:hypothetical protein ASE16_09970 [Leifsonia sp. Root227]|uniref:hypothetical protein n=1 Tax=Leifsonia sp. Root227 TaxID=1736496 RepID=UPI0006FF6F19|nr:hypothetical protein [Leifsonia sp. Root227]KRC51234.1 hypothetical protein ASE16_09970 [Leifsonia sp. Root227]